MKESSYISAGFDENILRDPFMAAEPESLYDSVNMGELFSAGSVPISGDLIQAGAVTQDKIDGISILGWVGNFLFTALSNTKVSWNIGAITLADGTVFTIQAGDTGTMSAVTYIYFDKNVSETALQVTTTAATSVGANKILVAVAQNVVAGKLATFQSFSGKGEGVLITADNIASGTITGNEIAANTIVANNIATGAITAIKIAAGTITADKIAAGQLVVGTNVGLGTATTLSAATTYIVGNYITTGYINALGITAGSINANDITAGTITGSVVQSTGGNGRIVLNTDDNLYFYDGAGNVQGSIKGHTDDLRISASDDVDIWSQGRTALRLDYDYCKPYDDAHYTIGKNDGHGLLRVFAYHFSDPSDGRYKDNVIGIDSALDKVMMLNGIYFNWNNTIDIKERQMGMIAQDVEKIIPEVVEKPTTKDGKYTITYGKIVPLLVEAIKELNNKIDKLSV